MRFRDAVTGAALPDQRADAVVACDGLHSVIREALHPRRPTALFRRQHVARGQRSGNRFSPARA